MIYFDHSATSFPKPPEVVNAVCAALGVSGNAGRGAHAPALAATRLIEQARGAVAAFFGCEVPTRVAFCKNVTEALNLAITSVDGHIVAAEAAHNAVLRPVYRTGNYSLAPADGKGRVAFKDIAALVRADTKAVVLGHGCNVTGNLAPVAQVGKFCRENGILFIVDAAQTAGLVPIDMQETCIDALCFTGHKALYGPTGTGGICLSERFTPKPLVVGGSGVHSFSKTQPSALPVCLEAGTANVHGIAGLYAGLMLVQNQTPAALCAAAGRVAAHFKKEAAKIPGVRFYGDYDAPTRLPVVALNVGALSSSDVADALGVRYDIAVRPGAHCAPLLHCRFGTKEQGAVRFSFSHQNTLEEADVALTALEAIWRANGNVISGK